jgi:hypothetical protein
MELDGERNRNVVDTRVVAPETGRLTFGNLSQEVVGMRRKRAANWIAVLLTTASCSRVYIGHPSMPPVPSIEEEAVVYVLGDLGIDNDSFRQVVRSLQEDVEKDGVEPLLLAVGDNLYHAGLPRVSEQASASGQEAIDRLRSIATLLCSVQFHGRSVPLVLVPGNHDYDGDALKHDRRLGDITRWYFPDALKIVGTEGWTMMPGDPESIGAKDSADLYRKLYENDDVPSTLATFMKPRALTLGQGALTVVGIDSELLLDLYATDAELADAYLSELERTLSGSRSTWTLVAAHHPLATGGAHHPGLPQRFFLGPGWPQYPAPWHKLLIWAGPFITLGRWAVHSRQDIHNGAYEQYRHQLYQVLRDTNTDLMLAGHDHNTQLIRLSEAFEDSHDRERERPLQVLTGEVSKVDPVAKQKGTVFYHADGGYVRIAVSRERIELEAKNRRGETIDKYALEKR